jgi:putative DNA primase/helicase
MITDAELVAQARNLPRLPPDEATDEPSRDLSYSDECDEPASDAPEETSGYSGECGEPEIADEPPTLLVWASDVVSRETKWLWRRRIPCGTVTICYGEPGGGKTHFALDVVTRVSRGSSWPDESGQAPQGNCLILSGEDDWETTLKPRLEYAGADLARVAFFPAVAAFGKGDRRTFSLTCDAATLEHNIKAAHATHLTVDPLTCFLSGVDTYKQADTRAALATLADVAERTGVSALCIMHPNKGDGAGQSALNRLAGSGAFGAAARSLLAVVADREDESEERRLLLSVKVNLALKPDGIGFHIVADDPCSARSRIDFDDDPVTMTADEAFGVTRADGPQATKAKALILTCLASGEPYPQRLIEEEAEAAGIGLKTLERAKRKLGVESVHEGFGPGSVWHWKLAAKGEER